MALQFSRLTWTGRLASSLVFRSNWPIQTSSMALQFSGLTQTGQLVGSLVFRSDQTARSAFQNTANYRFICKILFSKSALRCIPQSLENSNVELNKVAADHKANFCSYTSWLAKYPSALDKFEEMMSIAKEKEIVVFLDYDGTLSPIVDDPDQANMTVAMREAVHEVACCFPTAIVSGRSREKVYEFVKLRNVYYAGSHGMDISTPIGSSKSEDQKHQTKAVDDEGNQVVHFHPAKEILPTIQEIIKVLKEEVSTIEGSMVEDNKFCITVHYRQVKKDVCSLKKKVKKVMEAYPNFLISGGKKVIEIRPKGNWNKGCAVKYLLHTLGFDSFNNVVPLYIGDDTTDEDAFKVIRDIGQGFPIIVSSEAKETEACYSLLDPSNVMSFLIRLTKWKKS